MSASINSRPAWAPATPKKFTRYSNWLRCMQKQVVWWDMMQFTEKHDLGKVWMRGIGIRLASQSCCLPEVSFTAKDRPHNDWYYFGVDIAVEFLGESREEWGYNYFEKTRQFARAEIPEFWLVDDALKQIVVLTRNIATGTYDVHGTFKEGQNAASVVLKGFEIDVTKTLTGDRDR